MQTQGLTGHGIRTTRIMLAAVLLFPVNDVFADLVEMRNGDRYVGQVLNLDAQHLSLRNDNLGVVKLPRARVLRIHLGDELVAAVGSSSGGARPVASAAPAAQPDPLHAVMRGIQQEGVEPGLIDQIQAQFLSAAGPEAQDKFNSLLQGLIGGTLDLQDIRKEALSAAGQLRSLKQDLGEDTGGILDVYLGILDSFVDETEPAPEPTRRPARPAAAAAAPVDSDSDSATGPPPTVPSEKR